MTGDWELANQGRDKILAYFQELKGLHAQTHGAEPTMYKATEPRCVHGVIFRILASDETGLDFVAQLASDLVRKQCLGNLNHRTTDVFILRFLAFCGLTIPANRPAPGYMERFVEVTKQWHLESKRIMAAQEGSLNVLGPRERQERQHAQAAAHWIGNWLEINPAN